MGALFANTLRMTWRNKGVLIWTLLFPLILSSVFSVMFANINEAYELEPVPLAVVADEAYARQPALASAFEGAPELVECTQVESEQEARLLLDTNEAAGYVLVDAEGTPVLHASAQAMSAAQQTAVRALLDAALQASDALAALVYQNPALAHDASALAAVAQLLAADTVGTAQVSALHAPLDAGNRYMYALLGFLGIMASMVPLGAVARLRANASAVGARRQISATPPRVQLAVTLAASWLFVFAAMAVTLAYMRFALGVTFGDREGLALAACAVCALMSCALGAVVGALPRLPLPAKEGVATGLTVLLTLPAGLFGEPSAQLGNAVSLHAPALQAANPAVQMTDALFNLAYFDSLAPFAGSLGALALIAAALFTASALLMRRQRYAHL